MTDTEVALQIMLWLLTFIGIAAWIWAAEPLKEKGRYIMMFFATLTLILTSKFLERY